MRYAVLSAVVVAIGTALAAWYTHRHRAALYHRHGRPGVRHHIRPARLRLFARWVLSLRIHITLSSNARTA
jgi:hypothetical protein